jgi:hypothetical protein
VHVADANALLVQIFGEVLRHPFCQYRDQAAIAGLRGGADLADEIVDLVRAGRMSTGGSMSPVGRIT